ALLSSPFTVAKILSRLVEEGKARAAAPDEILASAKALLTEGHRTRGLKLLHRLTALALNVPALDVELAELFRIAGDARAAAQSRLRIAALARDEGRYEEARSQLATSSRERPAAAAVLAPLVEVPRALGDAPAALSYVRDLAEVMT